MKIERLEFVCTNAITEQSIVKIDLEKKKVTYKSEEYSTSENLQDLINAYVNLVECMLTTADRGQYQQALHNLEKVIACYIIQIENCDWMAIDKVTPKIVMNIEDIEI